MSLICCYTKQASNFGSNLSKLTIEENVLRYFIKLQIQTLGTNELSTIFSKVLTQFLDLKEDLDIINTSNIVLDLLVKFINKINKDKTSIFS